MRRGRERGAAMVEGVLMLPILMLLTFLVLHVYRTRATALRVTQKARACALEYALRGCETIPEGCPGALARGRGAPDDRIVTEVSAETRRELESVEAADPDMGSISTFPIVGDAIQTLFGERARAAVTAEVTAHVPGRQGKVDVTGRFVLACNGKPRQGGGVAKELFDALFD